MELDLTLSSLSINKRSRNPIGQIFSYLHTIASTGVIISEIIPLAYFKYKICIKIQIVYRSNLS